MAMNVEILSDVSDVVKGAATIADRYDEVSDTLKDLASSGDAAGAKIEAAFEDGVKEVRRLAGETDDATKSAKDLGRAGERAGDDVKAGMKDGTKAAKELDEKASDAFDALSDRARKAGKDVGKSQKDGFAEASEGAETFKENAGANAKEVAASFDGSVESISDGFQGLAAEMLEGFGPAGLLAGVAVAAGIGMAVTAMQGGAEAATELRQKSVDMVDAIVEAGGDIKAVDYAEIIKAWGREVMEDNWITWWADESTTKFQETAKDAKTYGIASRDAIRAAAGSAEDSRRFLDKTAQSWQDLNHKVEEGREVNEQGLVTFNESAQAAMKQRNALSDLRGQAEENIKTTGDAVEIYGLEADALGETKEAAEAAAQAIKDKADASDDAAAGARGIVAAENAWIETLDQMNKDIKTNGKTLDANTQAGRDNRANLVELAEAGTAYRDAAIASGDSTEAVTLKVQASRDAFIEAAKASGMGADAAADLATKYGLVPGNVATLVEARGTEEAKAAIAEIPGAVKTDVNVTATGAPQAQEQIDGVTGKTAEVKATATGTAETQKKIDDVKGKEAEVKVTDKGSAAAVQKAVDGLRGRDLDVNLRIGNERDFLNAIDRLTATRSLTVNVNERKGESVV